LAKHEETGKKEFKRNSGDLMKRLLPFFAVVLATSCSHAEMKPTLAKTAATTAVASQPAKSAANTTATAENASCKHGADVRNLAVVPKGEGCTVTYTKHGKTSELASAEHEMQHCKEVVTKVRGHLEAAGFSCN
jgi:hypothetical protein